MIRYKQQFLYFVTIFYLTFSLGSCASKRNYVYFYNKSNIASKDSSISYAPILKPDDILSINVSTIDPDASKPFNLNVVSYSQNNQIIGTPTSQSYLISADGTIDFPVIGKIKLAGLSRLDATNFIKEKLESYVENPIVNIRILNFKITVLGEVRNPGTFTIPNERITILDALGYAGDLAITGLRSNILVIRESNGKKVGTRVDLTSADLFNSSVFYLNQNDIIYVQPNKTKVNSARSSSNTSIVLTSISLLITTISVLLTFKI